MIAAGDTASDRPSAELMAECFPSVRLARPIGEHETLLSIDRARRVLGYDPGHSWRDGFVVHAGVAERDVDRG
jgi:UDP-glucose 4-epimerase